MIRDEEGVVADDIDQAVVQAAVEIEAMRRGGELEGMSAGWEFVVRSNSGVLRKRLAL
ncbi:hypothetical protein G3T14_15295 [Methylobacterium sp. BTF04]|uniref:DUF6894 family protein n=1 Tax=Methylobacterium sp. BTF04 TaxID=2708300 RepID=UPI0013D1B5F2|nr:hypothetical protein [Methylobacterium sp. BTF04]NEU13487.1 hypothetical protein [Methylobacterium sp. BTF04]